MTDTTARGAGPAERAHHAGGDGPAPARRRRMSAKRKQSAVLRLLRGEDLVSRELGVTAAELTAWRDAFLAAGEASLKTRPADGRDVEIGRLKAKVGDLTMTTELLEAKIAHLEGHRRKYQPYRVCASIADRASRPDPERQGLFDAHAPAPAPA
jgi:transposase-like protein